MLYRFADFEIDEERCEIRRCGRPLHAEPKAFELVLYLVRNRGRVVGKEELLEALWPDQDVFEGALSTCVHRARVLLNSDSRNGPIRNRPRLGYEFVADVVTVSPGLDPPAGRGSDIVGRAAPLEQIERMLSEVTEGSPRTLVLLGEPGIGKTTILAETMRRARRKGFRTWWVEARTDMDAGSFALWRDLLADNPTEEEWMRLRSSSSAGPESERILRQWCRPTDNPPRGAPPQRKGHPPDGSSAVLVGNLVALLRAQGVPLALGIDDLHAYDPNSLRLLERILRQIDAAPIFIVAASRIPGTSPLAAKVLRGLLQTPTTRTIRLEPLSRDSARALLETLGGGPIDESLIAAVVERVDGNPLFLIEFWRNLDARGLVTWNGSEWTPTGAIGQARLPENVFRTITERVRGFPTETRTILGAASICGDAFEPERVAFLLDRPARRVQQVLDEAITAAILVPALGHPGHFTFRHSLLRSACRDTLSGAVLRSLHQRLAKRLEAEGAAAAQIAEHLIRAVTPDKAALAARRCEEAGFEALSALAFLDAARWFRQAAEILVEHLPGETSRIAELELSAGESLMFAGEDDAAQAAFAASATAGRSSESVPEASQPAATGDRLLTMLRLGSELDFPDGDPEGALAERHRAIDQVMESARRRGDVGALAAALLSRRWIAAADAFPADRLRLSSEAVFLLDSSPRTDLLVEARLLRIHDLLESGRAADVTREIASAVRDANELEEPVWSWVATWLRAMNAQRRGDFEEAQTLSQEALTRIASVAPQEGMALFMMNVIAASAGRGSLGDCAGILEAAAVETGSHPVTRATLAGAYSDLGRDEDARRELDSALTALAGSGVFRRMFLPQTLAGLARPCRRLGDAQLAESIFEQLQPWRGLHVVAPPAAAYVGPVDGFLAMLASTARKWSLASELFETALAAADQVGCPQLQAHIQYEHAIALLARGGAVRAHAAGLHLREAEATARRLGLTGLLGWIEALRRDSGIG